MNNMGGGGSKLNMSIKELPYPQSRNTEGLLVQKAQGCSTCILTIPRGVSTSTVKMTREFGSITIQQCRRLDDDVGKVGRGEMALAELKTRLRAGKYYRESASGFCKQIVVPDDKLSQVVNTNPDSLYSQINATQQEVRVRPVATGGGFSLETKLKLTPSVPFTFAFNGVTVNVQAMTLYHPCPLRVNNVQYDAVLSLNDPGLLGKDGGMVLLIPIKADNTPGPQGLFFSRILPYISGLLQPNPATGDYDPIDVPVGATWNLTTLIPTQATNGREEAIPGYFIFDGTPPLIRKMTGSPFTGFTLGWEPAPGVRPVTYIVLDTPAKCGVMDMQTIARLPVTPVEEAIHDLPTKYISKPSPSCVTSTTKKERFTNEADTCDPFASLARDPPSSPITADTIVKTLLAVLAAAAVFLGVYFGLRYAAAPTGDLFKTIGDKIGRVMSSQQAKYMAAAAIRAQQRSEEGRIREEQKAEEQRIKEEAKHAREELQQEQEKKKRDVQTGQQLKEIAQKGKREQAELKAKRDAELAKAAEQAERERQQVAEEADQLREMAEQAKREEQAAKQEAERKEREAEKRMAPIVTPTGDTKVSDKVKRSLGTYKTPAARNLTARRRLPAVKPPSLPEARGLTSYKAPSVTRRKLPGVLPPMTPAQQRQVVRSMPTEEMKPEEVDKVMKELEEEAKRDRETSETKTNMEEQKRLFAELQAKKKKAAERQAEAEALRLASPAGTGLLTPAEMTKSEQGQKELARLLDQVKEKKTEAAEEVKQVRKFKKMPDAAPPKAPPPLAELKKLDKQLEQAIQEANDYVAASEQKMPMGLRLLQKDRQKMANLREQGEQLAKEAAQASLPQDPEARQRALAESEARLREARRIFNEASVLRQSFAAQKAREIKERGESAAAEHFKKRQPINRFGGRGRRKTLH
jgi:hypothetical protein